jgi:sodium transport system permease protein
VIRQLAGKEILSTVRDRRAIISNLLIPLLILPLIMLGLPLMVGGLFEREQETLTSVAVSGLADLPSELHDLITAQNTALEEVDDPEAAVSRGDYQVAIAVAPGTRDRLENGLPVELIVYGKRSNLRSELSANKIETAVGSYARGLVATRLRQAGVDPSLLEPIDLVSVDTSSEAEQSSGQLSWLIPFFIAIWTLAGGQMAAIDATAGEKERGTLEVLLVAPVRRSEVVVGKFIATLLFGLTAAVMAIIGYVSGGIVIRSLLVPQLGAGGSQALEVMGGSLSVAPVSVILLLVSALLLASLIAGILLGLTMFARSYKEAQSYVAPLSFLLILPALGLQFKDLLTLGEAVYLIPVFNVLVLMDDIVKGAVSAVAVAATWLSLSVVIGVLLLLSYRNFKREAVIFRT